MLNQKVFKVLDWLQMTMSGILFIVLLGTVSTISLIEKTPDTFTVGQGIGIFAASCLIMVPLLFISTLVTIFGFFSSKEAEYKDKFKFNLKIIYIIGVIGMVAGTIVINIRN